MPKSLLYPPGPKGAGALIRGLSRFNSENPLELFKTLQKKYGNFIHADFLIRQVYIVLEPELARYILLENSTNYRKGSPYEKAELFLGQGLLNSEGKFWRRQRRLAQPAFQKTQIASFYAIMVKHCQELLQNWRQQNKGEINLHQEMMRLTMNIIADAMFSMNLSKEAGGVAESLAFLNEYASERIRSNFNFPILVPTLDNLAFLMHSGRLNRLMNEIIEKRRNEAAPPNDLLTSLIAARDSETGEAMTNKQLRDELMTIFLAGHETTAMAMTMFFYHLSQNNQVRKNIQEEIRQTPCQNAENLEKLSLTNRALQETLRLNPPAWIIGRRALSDDQWKDYFIEKDIDISIPLMLIQRNPEYYERPEEFYINHFTEEAIQKRPRYTYLPFGAGPRQCIGKGFSEQEMLIIARELLKEVEFTCEQKEIELEPLFTLRPKQAITMKLKFL